MRKSTLIIAMMAIIVLASLLVAVAEIVWGDWWRALDRAITAVIAVTAILGQRTIRYLSDVL